METGDHETLLGQTVFYQYCLLKAYNLSSVRKFECILCFVLNGINRISEIENVDIINKFLLMLDGSEYMCVYGLHVHTCLCVCYFPA